MVLEVVCMGALAAVELVGERVFGRYFFGGVGGGVGDVGFLAEFGDGGAVDEGEDEGGGGGDDHVACQPIC